VSREKVFRPTPKEFTSRSAGVVLRQLRVESLIVESSKLVPPPAAAELFVVGYHESVPRTLATIVLIGSYSAFGADANAKPIDEEFLCATWLESMTSLHGFFSATL